MVVYIKCLSERFILEIHNVHFSERFPGKICNLITPQKVDVGFLAPIKPE